jgi:hypothetical protein
MFQAALACHCSEHLAAPLCARSLSLPAALACPLSLSRPAALVWPLSLSLLAAQACLLSLSRPAAQACLRNLSLFLLTFRSARLTLTAHTSHLRLAYQILGSPLELSLLEVDLQTRVS